MAGGSKKVVYAALGGNAAIAVTKFAAAWATGSSAMGSEAIHSLVDTGNQLLLLLGMWRSARPATAQHPFGYGLQLYFWAFVVAILIFGLGAGFSAYEGIAKIAAPHPLRDVWINYVVLALSLAIEGGVWFVALREFRRNKGELGWIHAVRGSKDPMVFTVLFEDSAAVLGLVVALLGIYFSIALDLPLLDGVASLIIAAILAGTAAWLAFECQSLLTGEGVAPSIRRNIRAIIGRTPGVEGINDLLTMHFGPNDVLIAASVDFDDRLSAADVERRVTEIEARVLADHPEAKRVFVEAQGRKAHHARFPAFASERKDFPHHQ